MSKIGQNIGRRVLRKRFKKSTRDKSVQNFDTAKSAVILFDTSLPDSFPAIKDFSKFLNSRGIATNVFGYVPQKESPQEVLLWANFAFVSSKDVNWYGSPKGEVAEMFNRLHPDLLFVICFDNNLTIDFFTWLSGARFKVGCYTENENDFDLMINANMAKVEVAYLIEQMKHYIQMLNPQN